MKSAIISAVTAFLCLGLGNAQLLRGPAADLEFPFYRYVLWNDLTDALRLSAVGLEYTRTTWESPDTNAIERRAWRFLGEDNQSNAAAMGFDEKVWDCYQNHYDQYEWAELVEIGVAQYEEAFGWDENSWNGVTDEPPAWFEFWGDLTAVQQDAAMELCFFRSEIWEGTVFQAWVKSPPAITLTDMPTEPPPAEPPTARPTSAAPSGSPTATPSAAPSESPTATPVPTESTISPRPTVISGSPSEMPSAGPSASKMPSAGPSELPTNDPTIEPSHRSLSPSSSPTIGTFRGPAENIDNPKYRYIVWELLDDATMQAATDFSYEEDTWNTPGSNPLEKLGWYSFDSEYRDLLDAIGFSEDVWDCFVNHHVDTDWALLGKIDVAKYLIVLGWDEEGWNGNADPPETDDKDWNELSVKEQEAAGELCYFEELWNGDSLIGDNKWSLESSAASISMSLIVASTFGALLLLIT
jgi:hypothetical protein